MATDLLTLAEYKAHVGINSTTQDTAISAIIPKVSALVKTICRRTFVDYNTTSKIEVVNGGTGASLFPKEYPIIIFTSLEYSIDYGDTYTALVRNTDYIVNLEDNTIDAVNGNFPKVINGYRFTYTGGYATLPVDLKLAVCDLVTYYIKNDMSVHSPKAPGTNSVQIEYITTTALPAHIKRILDLYIGSFD